MLYTKENKDELIGFIFEDPFCNGFFTMEFHERKIEAIGEDWIVVRDKDGEVDMAHFSKGWQINSMYELINKWLGL